MTTQQVAFLRAINVGRRRVEMARLRTDLEALGFDDVGTYINTGNAFFRSPLPQAELEPVIEERLAATFGFDIETFVRSADEVDAMAACRPFGTIEPGTTHMVAILRDQPTKEQALEIASLSGELDELVVIEREIHWHIQGGSLDSALKPKDWKRVGATLNTTRNMTMLTKLVTKLHG